MDDIFYVGDLEPLLLDSRLITGVRLEKYSYKIIKCGDYLQVYYYKNPRERQNVEKLDFNNLSKNSRITIDKRKISILLGSKCFAYDCYHTNAIIGSKKQLQKIEDRNIIRTKLNCQRLAKANAKEWKSFLTLTYADNMQDVAQAKLDLRYFVKNIKKVKKDFKYIAIPEFQKRGAIHFHLLTNLSLQDNNIITKQKNNNKYYDVKYWNKGFTSYEDISGDVKKIVGYISKYMTKDNADDRLFNFKRYTASQNLIKPVTEFISMRDKTSREWLINYFKDKECIYNNTYVDDYNRPVEFFELLPVNIIYIMRMSVLD